MDPFEVLGVSPDTPRDEVRAAYHRLARRHHPDLHAAAPPAEQARHERRMAEVTSAWRLINDPGALARHRARSTRAGAAPTDHPAGADGSRTGGPAGFDYRRAAASEFDVPLSGTWDRTPSWTSGPDRSTGPRRDRGPGRARRRWPILWLAVLVAVVVGVVLLGFTEAASAGAQSAGAIPGVTSVEAASAGTGAVLTGA